MMVIRRIGSYAVLVSALLISEPARSNSEENSSEKIFEYGSSCENLGQLSRVELVGVTHRTYSEQFVMFCKPESVYRCEDYSSALLGLGQLEDNGRRSCRYVPIVQDET